MRVCLSRSIASTAPVQCLAIAGTPQVFASFAGMPKPNSLELGNSLVFISRLPFCRKKKMAGYIKLLNDPAKTSKW